MVKFLINQRRNYSARKYHENHKKNMMSALELIKRNQGIKLSHDIEQQCNEYAVRVLGHILFAPELYVYSILLGSFQEGLIPNNYYKSVVVPQQNGDYGRIANFRLLENILFPSDYNPTVGSYSRGDFYDSKFNHIPDKDIKSHLFRNHDKIIFKLDRSFQGKGIYIFKPDNFKPENLKKLGTGIFQKYVNQDSFFSQFTPESVATIRITTTYDSDQGVKERGSYLRFSLGHDQFIKSNNSVRIGIDISTGRLYEYGYTSSWHKVEEHPDSKISFHRKTIPMFRESVELVKDLHQSIPFIKCIGWDVIITQNNKIKILEWNALGNDIDAHEFLSGPCFRELKWESLALKKLVRPYQPGAY